MEKPLRYWLMACGMTDISNYYLLKQYIKDFANNILFLDLVSFSVQDINKHIQKCPSI